MARLRFIPQGALQQAQEVGPKGDGGGTPEGVHVGEKRIFMVSAVSASRKNSLRTADHNQNKKKRLRALLKLIQMIRILVCNVWIQRLLLLNRNGP